MSERRPLARTLPGLLEEIARDLPRGVVIIHEGTTWSWTDFRAEARRMGAALIARGVTRGDRVAILFANGPEWLIAAFGAHYAGATVVPLNTWYKSAELEWTLRHANASALLSASRVLKQDYLALIAELAPRVPSLRTIAFSPGGAGVLGWDELLAAGGPIGVDVIDRARGAVSPEDVAFVLYTSGSTAHPKGVMLRHRGIIENGFDIGARRLINRDDRLYLGSPLFYALGAANAMPAAFTHGAALVLQDQFEAGAAIELIRATRATVYYGSGNMSAAIVAHPSYERGKIATLQKGSAGMVAEYKRLTLVEMGIRQATPAYGMTETYGHATGGMPDDPLEAKLHTNGRALPGMQISVVDPDTGGRLPQGVTGLLLVRGHIAAGYLDSPDESRVFRSDGYLDTGDLGSLDPEGRLIFHSRLKDIIKSGGINVSPVEVEQLLTQHPAVRDAYVVGVPHSVRGELIVAFVELAAATSEAALREFVRQRAASFKVPHHILFRGEGALPRLASGKVARNRLREEALAELG